MASSGKGSAISFLALLPKPKKAASTSEPMLNSSPEDHINTITAAVEPSNQQGHLEHTDNLPIQQHESTYSGLQEKPWSEHDVSLPSQQSKELAIQRTKQAIDKLLSDKAGGSSQPLAVANRISSQQSVGNQPKYIQYQATEDMPGFVSGVSDQRIIRLTEAPVDPMEPSRFKLRKAPPRPPSPPAPILREPPKKLSPEEANDWKIPPSVSRWKNIKGYTVSLETRLAAQGETANADMDDANASDRFVDLAESLFRAEKSAREEVEERARIQRQIAQREKERKEAELRELATKAREDRDILKRLDNPLDEPQSEQEQEPDDLESSVQDRDRLRQQRRKERENMLRQRNRQNTGDGNVVYRSQAERDRDRDISESAALGKHVGVGGASRNQLLFDQRLFNQAPFGLSSGHGAEDSYSIYDKPLFAAGNASNSLLYRPQVGAQGGKAANVSKFRADQGFTGGLDAKKDEKGDIPRAFQPVEFERSDGNGEPSSRTETAYPSGDSNKRKAIESPAPKDNDDPFGLNRFLTESQAGRASKAAKLDEALRQTHSSQMLGGGASAGPGGYDVYRNKTKDEIKSERKSFVPGGYQK